MCCAVILIPFVSFLTFDIAVSFDFYKSVEGNWFLCASTARQIGLIYEVSDKTVVYTFSLFFILFFFFCIQMSFKVEVLPSPKSELGEGPHWDEHTQSLYYVDIYGKESSILRYDYKENKVYSAKIDREPVVSFIIPVANAVDQYAVGIGRRVGIVTWDGFSPKAKLGPIAFEIDEPSTNRFNDAKVKITWQIIK